MGEDPQANSLSCKQSQGVMNGVAKGHHYPQGWGQPKMIMNMFEENKLAYVNKCLKFQERTERHNRLSPILS